MLHDWGTCKLAVKFGIFVWDLVTPIFNSIHSFELSSTRALFSISAFLSLVFCLILPLFIFIVDKRSPDCRLVTLRIFMISAVDLRGILAGLESGRCRAQLVDFSLKNILSL